MGGVSLFAFCTIKSEEELYKKCYGREEMSSACAVCKMMLGMLCVMLMV